MQRHPPGTYLARRLGLALIALGLPPLLALGGAVLEDGRIRASTSAYYDSFLFRDVFVGALIAVGFLLMLHRGFSTCENVAFNVADALVVGVAYPPLRTLRVNMDCAVSECVSMERASAPHRRVCRLSPAAGHRFVRWLELDARAMLDRRDRDGAHATEGRVSRARPSSWRHFRLGAGARRELEPRQASIEPKRTLRHFVRGTRPYANGCYHRPESAIGRDVAMV